MTDSVDTDALRKIAAGCNENNYNPDNGWLLGSAGDALDSAADEVDRLWGNLHDRDYEVNRLRAVIENAPHAYECFADFTPGSECTCWKADAL